MLAVIDCGSGNIRSVVNALEAVGAEEVFVTADPARVRVADRVVLPGVGAFGACMAALLAIDGLVDALDRRVRRDAVPMLGICVGMQLLADTGEEHGSHAGLGWIDGTVRRLADNPDARVPHMGWNDVVPDRAHPLIVPGQAYFLHSFAFSPADTADRIAATDHGGPVTAAVARETVVGVQFHPEKSQAYGLAFLSRFLEWRP